MTLEPKAQLYVLAVSAVGLAVLSECLRTLWQDPLPSEWLILAALTLLSGSFTVKIPKVPALISVSETFVFASVLLFGTCAGTITVALDTLVASLRFKFLSKEPIRVLFNLAAASISIWVSGHVFYSIAGIEPLHERAVRLPQIFLPLVALAAVYFLLNSGFVAVALSLERAASAFHLWRTNFLWLSVNYFGGASVAALLVSYTQTVDVTALMIIVPLLVISYLTFKTSLGRVEDASRHVEEVNQLYLSTIETLATAIDAKDQVTHGHIRRVQKYTLGLAKELGVSDRLQLDALEAAALLHDTGKLVVPEHILNKPGRLSPGEFERMKLHAGAGADILSAIKFPYPVVPIVRHHHENWDGTGYPDGLKGTDIPLGARILAVVDCFDALTSDRPYRGRLSDQQAMEILWQRRGNMYDPLIIDTFAAVKDKLADSAGRDAIIDVGQKPRSRILEQTTRIRISDEDFATASITVLTSLRGATVAAASALYLRDSNRDEAVVASVSFEDGLSVDLRNMPLGSGVSGWVIANGRSIANADAALDLKTSNMQLCTSVPIVARGEAVGALTCYFDQRRQLSEREIAVMERIASTFNQQPLLDLVTRALASMSKTSGSGAVH